MADVLVARPNTTDRYSMSSNQSRGKKNVTPTYAYRQAPIPPTHDTSRAPAPAPTSSDPPSLGLDSPFTPFELPSFSPELNGNLNENETPKPVPDRYHRGHKRTETTSSTNSTPQKTTGLEGVTASGVFGSSKIGQFDIQQFTSVSPPPKSDSAADVSQDDTQLKNSVTNKTDLPKRYRRRSNVTLDDGPKTPPGSRGGVSSTGAGEANPPTKGYSSQDTRPTSAGSQQRAATSRHEPSGRSFTSADTIRRTNNPSPLSRPFSGESSQPSVPQVSSPYSPNPTISAKSPAVAAMSALNANDKHDSKNSKSRLRRAFSFGSSAELKRATETGAALERARQRQERFSTELDEEQDAVARQQEASGLGNSIYTGQGGVFAGSTDNLSISSTASSASLMLRKMGKGMKKGGKSIKGLFRPKSVIGVPAADVPGEASVGPVSMLTVEAEREQVNVNADPHDQHGGGTGFPKLERNSMDAARASNPQANGERSDSKDSRRSIVGGEQDRQEVLAAVKRGILKRSGTGSPAGSPRIRPADGANNVSSPSGIHLPERRASPVPSTTSSEPRRTGHRRTDSHTLEGDDYFTSVPRISGNNQSTRSLPGTPRSINRNISFSPRIQFHDVWSSSEYDRRGEIATCNRLTPMLAQQIKEELNTFKMEMEVHESSKPHTHFF